MLKFQAPQGLRALLELELQKPLSGTRMLNRNPVTESDDSWKMGFACFDRVVSWYLTLVMVQPCLARPPDVVVAA